MTLKTSSIMPLVALIGTFAITTSRPHAAVVLSTDFSGMTINGSDSNQADNVAWTSAGLSTSSTSLVLENVIVNQNDGELFDTGAIATGNGYFGGNTNLSRSPFDGQWGTTVTVTAGSGDVSLESVAFNLVHANSSGTIGNETRTTQITATVFDGLNSEIGTKVSGDVTPANITITFDSPLTLTANDTYTVTFLVESNSNAGGHYAAFNDLAFNGTVVPEPATTSLLGLGGLALILRRRK